MKKLITSIVLIVSAFAATSAACPHFAPVFGRAVRINPAGKVLGVRAVVTLENFTRGETLSVIQTLPGGWYFIPQVPLCGQVYQLTASAKNVEFDEPARQFVFLPADDESGVINISFVSTQK